MDLDGARLELPKTLSGISNGIEAVAILSVPKLSLRFLRSDRTETDTFLQESQLITGNHRLRKRTWRAIPTAVRSAHVCDDWGSGKPGTPERIANLLALPAFESDPIIPSDHTWSIV